jgi:hypothetical protein
MEGFVFLAIVPDKQATVSQDAVDVKYHQFDLRRLCQNIFHTNPLLD